jgi:uncharacterized protein (DUF1778 family)
MPKIAAGKEKPDRLQLNLRLDSHKDLYLMIKKAAQKENLSLNRWVINALRVAVGYGETEKKPDPIELQKQIIRLEKRLAKLEKPPEKKRPDYEGIRDEVLVKLKLGSKSIAYRTAEKALNSFIKALEKVE